MKHFVSGRASILVLTAVFAVASFLLGKSFTSVFAKAGDFPKAYCHAAGQTGTIKFNYHYNKAWTAHFEDNGTPKAGHELDRYTFVGDKDCTFGSPTPTVSPTPSDCDGDCPTPTPEPETDACPNIEGFQDSVPDGYVVNENDECVPEQTGNDVCFNLEGIQTSVPDGYHQDTPGGACNTFSNPGPGESAAAPQGQVLGATTMAKTGAFDANAFLAIMGLGGAISGLGIKKIFKRA